MMEPGKETAGADTLRRSLSEVQRYRPARAALFKRMSTLRQTLAADGDRAPEAELRFNLTVDSIEEDYEEDLHRPVSQQASGNRLTQLTCETPGAAEADLLGGNNRNSLHVERSFDSSTLDDRNRSSSLSGHQSPPRALDDSATHTRPTGWLCTKPLSQGHKKARKKEPQNQNAALLGLSSAVYVNRMARRSVVTLPNHSAHNLTAGNASPHIRSVSQSGSTASVNSRNSTLSHQPERNDRLSPARFELVMVDAAIQVSLPVNELQAKMVAGGPSFDSSVTGSLLSVSGTTTRYKPARVVPNSIMKDDKRHVASKPASDMLQMIGADYLRYTGLQTFKQLQPVKELQRNMEHRPAGPSPSGPLPLVTRVSRSSSTPSLCDSANAPSDDFKLPSPYCHSDGIVSLSVQPAAMDTSNSTSFVDGRRESNLAIVDLSTVSDAKRTDTEQLPSVKNLATETSAKEAPIHKQPVARRLAIRKEIFEKRRFVAKCTFTACLVGLLLMITENEITLSVASSRIVVNHSDSNRSAAILAYKDSTTSAGLKMLISVSTVILEIFIAMHHFLEMRLFLVENGVPDWRLAVTAKRVLLFCVESVVCAVHPPPFVCDTVVSLPDIVLNSRVTDFAKVPLDVFLSVPMFLRAYLAFRVVVIHSRLLTDASSRSIGALNRISFNTRFVMKTFMTICPGTVIFVFIISLWLSFSWILRLCDSYHSAEFENYGNAIWLIAVTFFSIGYGDIVPVTLCGRVISILTGITGAGSTAFVVAVVARKLELSRAEKHVHNFMLDTHLTKTLKNAAANVLRETWLIYKYTKLAKRVSSGKVRHHQRKFLQALQDLRKVKLDQRKLNDNANQLVDVAKVHMQLAERMDETQEDQGTMLQRVESMEAKISLMQKSLDALPQLLVDRFVQRTLELSRSAQADVRMAVPSDSAILR